MISINSYLCVRGVSNVLECCKTEHLWSLHKGDMRVGMFEVSVNVRKRFLTQ